MDWTCVLPVISLILLFCTGVVPAVDIDTTLVATGVSNEVNITTEITGTTDPVVSFSDWNDNWLVDVTLISDPASAPEINYDYQWPDFKDIELAYLTEDGMFPFSQQNFYVGTTIAGFNVTNATSDHVIQVIAPLVDPLVVEVAFTEGTNITIIGTLVHNGFNVTIVNVSETETLMSFEASQFTESNGLYTLVASVSNPLMVNDTVESKQLIIAIQEEVDISDMSIYESSTGPFYVLLNFPFEILITFTSGQDVTSIVTFGNPINVFDIVGNHCNGTVRSTVVNYNFTTPGQFTLIIEAFNYASKYNSTEQIINAYYAVNGFSITVTDEITLFSRTVNIAVVTAGSAQVPMGVVTCTVTWGDTAANQSLEFDQSHNTTVDTGSQTFSKSYVAGWYYGSILCANELPAIIGSSTPISMTLPFSIISENVVENLVLSDDSTNMDNHPFSKSLTISVKLPSTSAPPLANLTCVFVFTHDSLPQEEVSVTGDITSSSNIFHEKISFGYDGDYDVNINCSNHLTTQTLTTNFTVYYDCWQSVEFFDPSYQTEANPIMSYTNAALQIKANIEFTSSCSGDKTYEWTVDDGKVTPLSDLYLNFDENTKNSGLYNISVKNTFTSYSSQPFNMDFILVKYELPALVASLTNGQMDNSRRYEMISDPIIFDSSGSVDPAGAITASEAVTRTWECRKGSASAVSSTDVDTFFINSGTTFPDSAPTNCNSLFSNPLGHTTYTLPANTLVDQEIMFVRMNYHVSNREASKSHVIFATPKLPILLQIRDVNNNTGNAEVEKLQKEDLFLNVYILNPELQTRTAEAASYVWKFEQYNKATDSFTDVSSKIANENPTSGSTSGFAVLGKDLGSDDPNEFIKYKVSCTVTINTPPDVYAIQEISKQYAMKLPPYGGDCNFNTAENVNPIKAGLTLVHMVCTDWKDEGDREQRNATIDNGGSLTYTFQQLILRADGQVNDSEPISVKQSGTKLDAYFKLTKPNLDENNRTIIQAVIANSIFQKPAFVKSFTVTVVAPFNIGPTGDDPAVLENVKEIGESFNSDVHRAGYDPDKVNVAGTVIMSLVDKQVPDPPLNVELEESAHDTSIAGVDVSASAAMDDIKEVPLDETSIKIRQVTSAVIDTSVDATSKLVKDEHGTVETQSMVMVMTIASQIAKTPFKNVPTESAEKNAEFIVGTTLKNLANAVGQYSPSEMDEYMAELMVLMTSVGQSVVPNEYKGDPSLTSAEGSRNLLDTKYERASDNETKDKEEALQSLDERAYFLQKNARIKQLVRDSRKKLGNIQSKNSNELLAAASKIPLSESTRKQYGQCHESKSPSCMAIQRTRLSDVENTNYTSTTTTVKLQGIGQGGDGSGDSQSRSIVVAISEQPVTTLETEEQAPAISSAEKKIKINMDGPISGMISIEQKVALPVYTKIVPTVDPEDASGFTYIMAYVANANDMLCLNILPESYDVDKYVIWINEPGESVSKVAFVAFATINQDNDYTVCFSSGQRRGRETGLWRIGIEIYLKAESTSSTSATTSRKKRAADDTPLPAFNFASATMSCLVWDEGSNQWKADTCDGTWVAAAGQLICNCVAKKEMTFANSFYEAPNAIDFSSVFLKFSPLNQAAIMAVLALVFIIYFLIVLWARRQDKKDLLKWGITPLSDNFAEDNYFYVIKVYTGMRPGSSTQSRVGFVMAGEEMDTGVRELADGVRKEFTTGSVMNFLMSTNVYLGDMEYMRIWHDNSGGGNNASWYLSKIEVQDVQRNETFVFMMERWLAVEKGDGLLECVVPVCKVENINKFKNRFFSNAKENLAESHIWISVVYRPQSSHFTRVQRASCALVFIMLTMISNAMFFKSSDTENYETPSEIQVGPFRFSLKQIYISFICAVITTPATLIVIYLFKMSKPKPMKREDIFKNQNTANRYKIPFMDTWLEKEQQRSVELEKHLVEKGYPQFEGLSIPYWGRYIAWFLVFLATVLSGFFIMLYSMEWGKQKSEEWLTTFFMSFFESVFCLDPVKIAFMAVIFSLLFRSTQDSKPIIKRSTVMKKYSSNLRSQSGGVRLPAPPLDQKKLAEAKDVRQRELRMKTNFRDMISTVLIIWVMFSISYSNRDINSYNMHHEIVQTLLEPIGPDAKKFSEIRSVNNYYEWMNDTVILNMFPEKNTIGEELEWRQKQFTSDLAKFRVGPPRLRQVRSRKDSCTIPHMGTFDCYKKYETHIEDTNSYCIGWETGECDPKEEVYQNSADAWKFTSALDIWGFPISGVYTTYGGGGYIAKMSVNRQVSQIIMGELYLNSWVDRQTRAVIVEFTLYCINANLFTYNMFMVEFPETGGAFPFYMILPLRVYHHVGSLGYYTLACEIIFLVYILYMTILAIIGIYKQRKSYFKGWQLFDIIFLTLSYVAIVMYIGRMLMANKSLSVFREDHKEFVNFYHVALWDLLFVLLTGILTFLATLRLLNILGYNKRIGAVARIFTSAASELIWFGIFFMNVFTCYAVFGYLLFGTKLTSYNTVFKTMGTLFISMIGKSRFTEIEQTDPIMSKIYFMIFIFFVVYMILTMFLAILSKSIDEVHNQTKTDKGDEMVEYAIKKLKSLLPTYGGNGGSKKGAVQPAKTSFQGSHKTRLYEINNRQILEDIRMSLNDALNLERNELKTPDEERKAKKAMARFRR